MFSPNGKQVASILTSRIIALWNSSTRAALKTLLGHSSRIIPVVISKLVASASADATVILWDSFTGAIVHTLEGHEHDNTAIAFPPNRKHLVSASFDKMVRFWDLL